MEQWNDTELLAMSAKGNRDAFAAIFERRHKAVYRFALEMSASAATADEVTQEVFLLLIREPHRFDPSRGSLASFLYGVARNLVLRQMRTTRRECPVPELVAPADLSEDIAASRRIEDVRRAVMALPPRYREVVVLCDLHEMSYAEAAQVAGCALGTLRSRLNRARNLLAAKLRSPAGRCLV